MKFLALKTSLFVESEFALKSLSESSIEWEVLDLSQPVDEKDHWDDVLEKIRQADRIMTL